MSTDHQDLYQQGTSSNCCGAIIMMNGLCSDCKEHCTDESEEPAMFENQPFQLLHGDCLQLMQEIPDKSVDLILCDLPYGTTACKWDSVIPLAPMWEQYRRISKGAIVLTGSQPFTSVLISSNLIDFRYCWVWDKVNKYTGALNANRMPLKRHEDVAVFYEKPCTYNKQFRTGKPFNSVKTGGHGSHTQYGAGSGDDRRGCVNDGNHNPCSVLQIPGDNKKELGLHPTQKPVALMEYLIRTYTNEGDTVLDNTMGSGTTGVACLNTGRKFIGIEKDEGYFQKAKERIEKRWAELNTVKPPAPQMELSIPDSEQESEEGPSDDTMQELASQYRFFQNERYRKDMKDEGRERLLPP